MCVGIRHNFFVRQHFFLIEGEIESGELLFLQSLALVCRNDIAEEHGGRQTVVNKVVEIGEEVHRLRCLVYLQPVHRVVEDVERTHLFLEEGCVGFRREFFASDNRRFVVVALLHHVVGCHYKTCLDIAVGIHRGAEGSGELVHVGVFEPIYIRYIILCGVAVLLPLEINAALVLAQGIYVLLGVRLQHRSVAVGTGAYAYYTAHGGVFHYVGHLHLYAQRALQRHGKAHGGERGKSHADEVCGDAELVGLQQFRHDIKEFLLLVGLRRDYLLNAELRFGQCLAVHLSVGGEGHFVELHEYVRHHVVRQGLRHEG